MYFFHLALCRWLPVEYKGTICRSADNMAGVSVLSVHNRAFCAKTGSEITDMNTSKGIQTFFLRGWKNFIPVDFNDDKTITGKQRFLIAG